MSEHNKYISQYVVFSATTVAGFWLDPKWLNLKFLKHVSHSQQRYKQSLPSCKLIYEPTISAINLSSPTYKSTELSGPHHGGKIREIPGKIR